MKEIYKYIIKTYHLAYWMYNLWAPIKDLLIGIWRLFKHSTQRFDCIVWSEFEVIEWGVVLKEIFRAILSWNAKSWQWSKTVTDVRIQARPDRCHPGTQLSCHHRRDRYEWPYSHNMPPFSYFNAISPNQGSGKTTQIPQYILEEMPEMKKIGVTQPR